MIAVGTKVTVKLSKNATDFFSSHSRQKASLVVYWFDWYRYKYPVVEYKLNKESALSNNERPEDFFVPLPTIRKDECGWFFCRSKVYSGIFWNYMDQRISICNGITISDAATSSFFSNPKSELRITNCYAGTRLDTPSISLIDFHARLDLHISRNHINQFISEDVFVEELCKYKLARMLMLKIDPQFDHFEEDYIVDFSKNIFTMKSRTFLYHIYGNKESSYIAVTGSTRITSENELPYAGRCFL